MKTLILTLAGALLIAPAGLHAQNRNDRGGYADAQDPRQHGNEHGYRDGADRARQDRERGIGYSFRDTDYLDGARDYDRSFGDRRQYMSGYQEGFKAGYDDGFKDQGRYGQIYQRPAGDGRGRPKNYRFDHRASSVDINGRLHGLNGRPSRANSREKSS